MPVDCRNSRPGVEVACLTDIGRMRENNEDSFLYWEAESDAEFRRKGRLCVIADGMGGYEGGQEASRLAVQTVQEVYDKSFRSDPSAALLNAFTAAHDNIQGYASQHLEFQGMGTTCTALALIGRQLYFAHIGDSRLYLVRRSTVSRLTRDHSYVGRLVESGIVRPEDAETHPQRHILTAAMGSGRELAAEVSQQGQMLDEGDTLVLCTDGLWSQVSEHEVAVAVEKNTPAESCRALVNLALERGGPDNITIQVLKVSA